MIASLRPAALAFDAVAPTFDSRFGAWASVAAQRRAVRAALLQQFPSGGRILEVGGGTGEDAAFLAERGFNVLLTDPSPTMVKLSTEKLAPFGATAEIAAGEEMEDFAERYLSAGRALFDGAFSNFAPLNCVNDLTPVARGLARLLNPGATAMLVLFGTCCPGEIAVEVLRGRPHQALRRWKRGTVPARLAKREFHIVYHWYWRDRATQRCRAVDFKPTAFARRYGGDRPYTRPSSGDVRRPCVVSASPGTDISHPNMRLRIHGQEFQQCDDEIETFRRRNAKLRNSGITGRLPNAVAARD
jgi:SAM-dependent methyltransferase